MKIVYDATLKQPGCVILQAAFHDDHMIAHRFPTETWLTAPTDDLAVYEVTEAQLDQLVEITKAAHEERKAR